MQIVYANNWAYFVKTFFFYELLQYVNDSDLEARAT